jgi:hypothetical protein
MLSLAIFGGTKVDSSMLDPGERIVALALFGGIELDFAAVPPPPAVDVLVFAVFGGVTIKVRPAQPVRLAGFSFFGGRDVDSLVPLPTVQTTQTAVFPRAGEDEIDLPLDISAYAIFGGMSVKRDAEDSRR